MHVLLCGKTGTGKTTLARRLVDRYRRPSIVLDRMRDEWATPYVYTDSREFVTAVAKARECMVFIDESGEEVGRYNDEMFWLATQARHLGHVSHFLTQRPAQLSPTVRTQCTSAFVFRLDPSACRVLSLELTAPEVYERGPSLDYDAGEYLYVQPNGRVSRDFLFPTRRTGHGAGFPTPEVYDRADSTREAPRGDRGGRDRGARDAGARRTGCETST